MRQLKYYKITSLILSSFVAILFCTTSGHSESTDPVPGFHIVIEPQVSEIQVGETVLVKIFADSATDLISMGVTVSFNPEVLRVVSASKNTDYNSGWVMDADGDPGTTDDQYTTPAVEIDNDAGTVTMIGGRLTGENTTGLSGKVLLGEISFEAISSFDVPLFVDLARYHSEHPNKTFDNFVCLDGKVDEPVNVPGMLGKVYVGVQATGGGVDEPVLGSGSLSDSSDSYQKPDKVFNSAQSPNKGFYKKQQKDIQPSKPNF